LSLAVLKASVKPISILFGGYLGSGHSPDPISADVPKVQSSVSLPSSPSGMVIVKLHGRYSTIPVIFIPLLPKSFFCSRKEKYT